MHTFSDASGRSLVLRGRPSSCTRSCGSPQIWSVDCWAVSIYHRPLRASLPTSLRPARWRGWIQTLSSDG